MKTLLIVILLSTAAQASPTPRPPPEWTKPAVPRLFYSLTGGSGTGIIGGQTEAIEADVETGFQWEPLHVRAELGAFRNSQLAFSIVARLGFTPKTDTDPPVAKALMLRVYRMCRPVGLRFHGEVGGGYIRYRTGVNGTDVDTMAAGPLIFGGGVGYAHPISDSWRVVIDATALAAIATADKYGGVRPEHALHFDLGVGLVVYR